MKLSARNTLAGTVKQVTLGPVSAEVIIEVAGQAEIVAVISAESAKALDLKQGKRAYAVIKASNVMVGVD